MILDMLAQLLDVVLGPVIDMLPKHSIADDLPHHSQVGAVVYRVDQLVPVRGPLAVIVAYLGFAVAFVTYRIAIWIWTLIPGKAT